ncbi:MAG: site-specific integrase [Sulfuricaulis sp.]|nr:site-specific integrase [Sulfuricaulis sp.]
MSTQRLTDIAMKAIQPPESGKQVVYWDENLRGFGVRVSPAGAKTFFVMRSTDLSRTRETIGRYPEISLSEARTEAKRILAERTLGKSRPTNITYDEALKRFLLACEQKNKPRTVADYRRHLNLHFKFAAMQLSDITLKEISRRVDRLKATPSEQSHAFVALKIFLRWAVKHRMLERSPIEMMTVPSRQGGRERTLSKDEIAAVYRAARLTPHPYGTIVQLLLLTGQRRGEIAALQWNWIDQASKTITLPSSITKNGRQHTFPYGDVVGAVLATIPVQGDLLFPASRTKVRGNPTTIFNGWGKPKALLDATIADAGTAIPPWTLHDLRRTFATNLAALQTPVHVTEKLLNHVSGTVSGVAAIYNRHSYMDEMREAATAYENYLQKLLAK